MRAGGSNWRSRSRRERADDGRQDSADQRVDDRAESGADDDADGEIDRVSPQCKFLEFVQHLMPPHAAIPALDASCPGLTRASIEKKRVTQAMDCRVKHGNDTARTQRRKHTPTRP